MGKNSPDFDRGFSHAREHRYDPPGGKSVSEEIARQILGAGERDRKYHEGQKAGRRSR